MCDFIESKIYALQHLDGSWMYIGSTTDKLKNRFVKHKAKSKICPNRLVYIGISAFGGWENFKIVLVERYPCVSAHDLREREQYWIDQIRPVFNKNNAVFSKEKTLEKNRERDRERYHSEKRQSWLKMRKETRVDCACGSNVSLSKMYVHLKSLKHGEYLQRTSIL